MGKTVLTGLLLQHLRQRGCHALAMKPFCSGSRGDAEYLQAAQEKELTQKEVNPFFFAEPLAPLVAARQHHRSIHLRDVLGRIKNLASRCQCLLIEGVGGVLVPLGEGYSVVDLIANLACETIVVSRNRLGTINHTRLAVDALRKAGIKRLKVVLMSSLETDSSTKSNGRILVELLAPIPVFRVPFLGRNPSRAKALAAGEKKVKKTVAQILA